MTIPSTALDNPYAKTIGRLLAPLEIHDFIENHLGQCHLLVRGDEGKFATLLDWATVEHLLNGRHGAIHDDVSLHSGGRPVSLAEPESGPRPSSAVSLSLSKLAKGLPRQSTLVVAAVDGKVPALSNLVFAYESTFQSNCRADLYLSFGAELAGRDTHWNDHDTLVLQLAGRKCWRLWQRADEFPLDAEIDRIDPPGKLSFEEELRPGDLLYFPRGTWYETATNDRESLHVAIYSGCRTGHDFLAWLLGRAGLGGLTRKDVPRFSSVKIRAKFLEDLRDAFLSSITPEKVHRYLAETAPDPGKRVPISLPWAGRLDEESLPADAVVGWRAPRLFLCKEGDVSYLCSQSIRLPLSPGEQNAAEHICRQNWSPVKSLLSLSATELTDFLHKGVTTGLLIVVSAQARSRAEIELNTGKEETPSD